MKLTAEKLTEARNLITPEKNWCKGYFGIDTYGIRKFCAYGAIGHVMGVGGHAAQDLYAETFHRWDLSEINNYMGHDAVLARLDKDIETLKQRERLVSDMLKVTKPVRELEMA
jgi:hypothetical protein